MASWVPKSFKNRIYLYAHNYFCFSLWVELPDRTTEARKIHFECGGEVSTVFTGFCSVFSGFTVFASPL